MKGAWAYVSTGMASSLQAFKQAWQPHVRRVQSDLLLLAFVRSRLLASHEQEEEERPPRHEVLLAAASRGHELLRLVMTVVCQAPLTAGELPPGFP